MNSSSPAPLSVDLSDAEADFCEFAEDRLELEAARWALRQRHGLDAAGARELAEWLAVEARHVQALEEMEQVLGGLGQIPVDQVEALRAALPQDRETSGPGRPVSLLQAARPSREPGRTCLRWSGFPALAQAASVLLLCGAAWLGWQHWQRQAVFTQAYATERGQQLTLSLPDAPVQGSSLQLDTASRAEVRLYRDRREVHLQSGQAMFVVHPDRDRPFHVWAGATRITVVGTRFSVRYSDSGRDAGQTVVEVEEGRVRVAAAAEVSDPAGVELGAGQRVAADAGGRIGAVTALAPAAVASWREGRVNFEGTPLAEAIAEFERYGHTGLVLRDPAVAALPVGGSYSLRQYQQFARALPQILPVRLVPRGELVEVLPDPLRE